MGHISCRIFIMLMAVGAMTASTAPGQTRGPADGHFILDRYHTPQELNAAIDSIHRENPDITAVHTIAQSAGKRELRVLEIGPDTDSEASRSPAVFVVGNLEGTIPIASEAAVFLAYQLIEKDEARKDLTWYILAAGNPDGAARFFTQPLFADGRNQSTHNDDMDDAEDEDGPDDLDGNGMITRMRVKDPAGEWIPVEEDSRLMRRADPIKGEKGIYKLYTEGIDNDGDGQYNEDGPGGTDIGITFPHLFRAFTPAGGDWPGSEPETYAIMKFVMDRPEIAMTFTLGATNMCLQPPAGGRKGEVDLTRIKVPERYAGSFGADPDATYSLEEIMEMMRPMMPPGTEITEMMVSSMLGLGAVVNPLPDDLKFYEELSARYKDFLKENGLDGPRLKPMQPKDGSFELWSYYHLGVPTFSMDFWTLPEVKPEANEENADTSEAPKPKQKPDIKKPAPGPPGMPGEDPKMKALLAFSDEVLQGEGFVPWIPFEHPTLDDVEIGGAVPYTDSTPPPAMIEELITGQLPWVFELVKKLPRVSIHKIDVATKGSTVYELSVWVQNIGELPLPTAMGKRNQHVGPIILTLDGEGFDVLSGKQRTILNSIDAMQSRKLTWLLHSEEPQIIRLILESANAWTENGSEEIRLGGAQ